MKPIPLKAAANNDKVTAVINVEPALAIMECKIPLHLINQLNDYIDSTRDSAESHAPGLVGQINQRKESGQLYMNREDSFVKEFVKTLEKLSSCYISTMGYEKFHVECDDIWTVHSYAGDYNPLHNHYVKTKVGLSSILYLKLSDEMLDNKKSTVNFNNASGDGDGHTFFTWGTTGTQDIDMMRYNTERYVKPEVGKLLIFPHWLKHSVNPFFGEGERRTLAANFNVATNDKLRQHVYQLPLKQ